MLKEIALLIVIAITSPIIVARSWTVIIASAAIVINRPVPINEDRIVAIIIASGRTINTHVQRRSNNGRGTSVDFAFYGVDAPA
jgi:hypothetical protein